MLEPHPLLRMRTHYAMSASAIDVCECSLLTAGSQSFLDEGTFEQGGCATPRDSAFRKMMQKIANHLDGNNVESIVFLNDLPQDLKGSSSLHVLNYLYRRRKFSTRNVEPLKELLRSIDRYDLVSDVIEDYLTRVGRYNSTPPPKSPRMFPHNMHKNNSLPHHLTIAEETMERGSTSRQLSHEKLLSVGLSRIQSGPPGSNSSLSQFSSTNSLMDDQQYTPHATSSPILVPSAGNFSESRHNDSSSRLSSRSNTPYTPSPSPSFPNSQEDTMHTSSAPKIHPLHHAKTCPLFQQYNDLQTQTVEAAAVHIPVPVVYGNNTPNTGASPPVCPAMELMSYQLEVHLVPSTAPLQRANFAQTLSAAKSDSRLNEVSPQDLNRSSSQNPVQQSENETKHPLSSRGDPPDLLEGACGPQPQRLTTDLNNSAESRGVEDTQLPPPITQYSSHESRTQRPHSGKSARKLRLPWKTTASTSREVFWRLKRSELNEAICEHREQKFFSSPHKLVVEFGHGKANPRLALRLFPYGLETDREKNATLEICIEVPRKCPRLHSSAKTDILLSVWDCKENALLSNKQHLSVSMNMRTVLVSDFISHDHLRHSRSEYVEIKAATQMPTSHS